jgi:adenylate cyclase
MMNEYFKKLLTQIAAIGADANDDEETRLQKSLLVICSFPFTFAGAAWGLMYISFGETLAGLIPLSYSIISIFSIIHFSHTRRYGIFRFSQLMLILLLPCALMTALGGFISGSAVILWALICPLGSMLFAKPKQAPRWFLAFALLVIVSGILQPWISFENNLTVTQRNIFFIINLTGVGSLIFIMVFYFVQKKNYFQERSEALLLNILPKEIADILRKETITIADHFDNASILFADLVDFTPMSESMSPTSIVELLNEVFSEFDSLADKYDLEKIKTIGDCYMVASGVPRPRPDHAIALVNMAVDMRDYVNANTFMGRRIQFRFGINSGPVVAGVIGRKKFIYDLWGDSVNVASRMESQGRNGLIQVTQETFELIKEDFTCEFHGDVEVKGKGALKVWVVDRRK